MGRKTQPINVVALHGRKHLTKDEIERRKLAEGRIKPKSNRIRPPDWLNDEAKQEFRRIMKEMKDLDVITNVDVDALAVYCDAYVTYIECTRIIENEGYQVEHTNKSGATNMVPHPMLAKKRALADQMKAMATEIGLTPSSRAKISLPPPKEKDKTPFEERFGGV
ncbi:MAG: phage terminase small subunit P27 family [Syntrophales bacterium]|nr:phage terminase small subunit P27 family [Syntrophales bacterium]